MKTQKNINWKTVNAIVIFSKETEALRDILATYVFPELIYWCGKWKLFLQDVYWDANKISQSLSIDLQRSGTIQVFIANTEQSELGEPFLYPIKQLDKVDTFSKKVLEELKSYLSLRFQERLAMLWKNIPSWQIQQRRQQFFALSCRQTIERKNLLERLINYILSNNNKIFAVYGQKNSGKTTLLSKLYRIFLLENVYKLKEINCVAYFADINTASFSLEHLLTQLCQELRAIPSPLLRKMHQKMSLDSPQKTMALIARFFELLKIMEITKTKTVIILDGIDHPMIQNWHWLPDYLPRNVKIIVSANEGACKNALSQKITKSLSIPSLKKGERKKIIHSLYDIFPRKQLTPLLNKSDNPLYLNLATKLLKNSNKKDLSKNILGLSNNSTIELFKQLLSNLEQEFSKDLIEVLFSLLYCSQEGLSSKELRNLLVEIDDEMSYLLVLYNVKDFLTNDGQSISLSHQDFIVAIEKTFPVELYHDVLAQYFASQSLYIKENFNIKKLKEQPYQEICAGNYETAIKTLSDIEFLEAKVGAGFLSSVIEDFQLIIDRIDTGFCVKVHKIEIDKNIIILVKKILTSQFVFLEHHPLSLFSIMWNYGYWHDAAESQKHYCDDKGAWSQKGPKLSALVEHWRQQKESKKITWLKSMRPLPQRLDTPLEKTIYGHSFHILNLAVHPQENKIASISFMQMRLWNTNGQLLCKKEIDFFPTKVDFSPDGKLVAVSGEGNHGCIWEVESGRAIELKNNKRFDVMFSSQGQIISIEKSSHVCVRFFSLNNSRASYVWKISSHMDYQGLICATAISSDTKTLAFCTANGLSVFDIPNKKHIYNFKSKKTSYSQSIHFSPCNTKLIWVINSREFRVCDIKSKKYLIKKDKSPFGKIQAYVCGRFSPDGTKIAFTVGDSVEIWDAQKFVPLTTLKASSCEVSSLCFTVDSQKIITGANDGTIRIWDLLQSKKSYTLKGPQKNITDVNFNFKTDKIICSSIDEKACIFNSNGELLTTLEHPQSQVSQACIAPDDQHLITVSTTLERDMRESMLTHGILKIWDISGKLLEIIREVNVSGVCISSDNKYIATINLSGFPKIWDLATRREIHTLRSHNTIALSISPDAKKMAQIGYNDVSIWDLASKKVHFYFNFKSLKVSKFCWSTDGSKFAINNALQLQFVDIIEKKLLSCSSFEKNNFLEGRLDEIKELCFGSDNKKLLLSIENNIYSWEIGATNIVKQSSYICDLKSMVDRQQKHQFLLKNKITKVKTKKDNKTIASLPIPVVTKASQNTLIGSDTNHLYIFQLINP